MLLDRTARPPQPGAPKLGPQWVPRQGTLLNNRSVVRTLVRKVSPGPGARRAYQALVSSSSVCAVSSRRTPMCTHLYTRSVTCGLPCWQVAFVQIALAATQIDARGEHSDLFHHGRSGMRKMQGLTPSHAHPPCVFRNPLPACG